MSKLTDRLDELADDLELTDSRVAIGDVATVRAASDRIEELEQAIQTHRMAIDDGGMYLGALTDADNDLYAVLPGTPTPPPRTDDGVRPVRTKADVVALLTGTPPPGADE